MARSPPDQIIAPGAIIGGRYRLKRQLAAGGMGTVWLGSDQNLGRRVALKILAQQLASHPELLTRFEREAKAVAQLRSIHVVEVYDYGLHDQLPYIVMELLEGESLRSRLRRVGHLSLRETVIIADQIAKGLKAAHGAGLIHRDLKPSNVFVALQDDVEIIKLLDFGVVKAIDPGGGSTDMTASGTLLGTPQYMSPEQVRARRPIDHRSDLWALGVIVFRMLTGINPFRGESVGDAALRICSDELPRLADYSDHLPQQLDRFFLKAFARSPGDRFQTALELAAGLRSACAFAISDVTPEETAADQPGRDPNRDLAPNPAVPVPAIPPPNAPPRPARASAQDGSVPAAPSGSPPPRPSPALDESADQEVLTVTRPVQLPTRPYSGSQTPALYVPPVQPTTPSIPGTSIPLPVQIESPTPISTTVGGTELVGNLMLVKHRLTRIPMPLLLGTAGTLILGVSLAFIALSGEETEPAGAAAPSDAPAVSVLGRWNLKPPADLLPDDMVIEPATGAAASDAGTDAATDTAPPTPPGSTGMAPTPPDKRDKTPPEPVKAKEKRPKWF